MCKSQPLFFPIYLKPFGNGRLCISESQTLFPNLPEAIWEWSSLYERIPASFFPIYLKPFGNGCLCMSESQPLKNVVNTIRLNMST
jgi:hypothetical protein